MIPDDHRPGTVEASERLDRFRELLRKAAPPAGGWPNAVRQAIQPIQADEYLARDPDFAEALGRLVLIAEVWDCLGSESADEDATLRTFFETAAEVLANAIDGGGAGDASTWIIRESDAHWGTYLAIIDPTADVGPSHFGPSFEADCSTDQDEYFDASALIRTLSGMIEDNAKPRVDPPDSQRPGPIPQRPGSDSQPGPSPCPARSDPIAEARSLQIDDELRDILIADLSDLLARIQELVLGLGQPGDSARLHELGRCYHTLKGASGSVGLSSLAGFIHDLEDAIEQGGGSADAILIGKLEESLSIIEGTLDALRGSGPIDGQDATLETERTGDSGPPSLSDQGGQPTAQGSDPSEADGLIRVPATRFEELTDLCSELLTRRRLWAEQADRMKRLAASARGCGQRLRASVDRLEEALPTTGRTDESGRRLLLGDDLPGQIRRLVEQAEDLSALAATAREAAFPMAGEAEDLSRLSLRLWDGLQSVRIIPVRSLFQRLIRVARDAARVEGRSITVELIGEETGADRLLLDRAYEPLLHVVRNAVGHGIEPPEERERVGKPPEGRIVLEARREGNTVILEVRDDGRGLDFAAIEAKGRRLGLIEPNERPGADRLGALIFQSGFSTRGQANAVSGRGVGMDVVAREVEAMRGRVDLTSEPSQGTRLSVRLPARIALEHMMVVRIRGQAFAVPTSAIDAVGRASVVEPGALADPPGPVAVIGERRIRMIDPGTVLGFSGSSPELCPIVLVVASEGGAVALRVDGIDGPEELVLQPLGPLLAGNPAVSGAGLSTGGEVIPALDVSGLLRLAEDGGPAVVDDLDSDQSRPVALVVDDSLSVRRIATRHLRALGFEVAEASDGEEALGSLRARPFDLILTDLEMPRMDGFALLSELRRTGVAETSRVVVTSTLSDPSTRRRVLELGAAAFVPKPVDPEELAAAVGPAIPPHPCKRIEPGVALEPNPMTA